MYLPDLIVAYSHTVEFPLLIAILAWVFWQMHVMRNEMHDINRVNMLVAQNIHDIKASIRILNTQMPNVIGMVHKLEKRHKALNGRMYANVHARPAQN